MADAGGAGCVRKFHGVTLADLGDVEGFGEDGEEISYMLFSWRMGCTDEKLPQEENGPPKFEELSDIDITHATPKRVHTLVFTGEKWFPFADPVQQTRWLIDIKISSPSFVTGQQHKVRTVVNSGTRLCSFVPKTKNIVISESYTLKTNNAQQGVLRIVSKFSPAGIIGLGLVTSTILLEMVLGDRPNDFVEVMPRFKLKWTLAHANRDVGVHIIAQETPQVRFTFGGI